MPTENLKAYPFWQIRIATDTKIDGHNLMAPEDVDHLAPVNKFFHTLSATVSSEFTCTMYLCQPSIYIFLKPADGAPPTITVEECRRMAGEITNLLQQGAAECRANAASPQPLPLDKALSSPSFVPVLKALVGGDRKPAITVAFHDGGKRLALPTMAASDFTAGEAELGPGVQKNNVLITGLIRNTRDNETAIELQDVTGHVDIPRTWRWEMLRDALEVGLRVTGRLTKQNGRYQLSENAQLLPPLDLPMPRDY